MKPLGDDLSWSLIGRAVSGDDAARDKFGHAYLPTLRGILRARWLGTPWEAEIEDAVQEVFVECLRGGGALTGADAGRGDLGGYLYGVTRNVALRFEERARRRRSRDADIGSMIELVQSREATLSCAFDRDWARMLVRLAGERMRAAAASGSDGARLRAELLELRFGEGLPIREIAARWGAEPRHVHKAYERAREEFKLFLRRVLQEHGGLGGDKSEADVGRLLELLD